MGASIWARQGIGFPRTECAVRRLGAASQRGNRRTGQRFGRFCGPAYLTETRSSLCACHCHLFRGTIDPGSYHRYRAVCNQLTAAPPLHHDNCRPIRLPARAYRHIPTGLACNKQECSQSKQPVPTFFPLSSSVHWSLQTPEKTLTVMSYGPKPHHFLLCFPLSSSLLVIVMFRRRLPGRDSIGGAFAVKCICT